MSDHDHVVIPPEITRLGAELRAMSPARRQLLAQAATANGWPAWWAVFYDRPGGWRAFQAMCAEAVAMFGAGIPVEASLLASEQQRAAYGFDRDASDT